MHTVDAAGDLLELSGASARVPEAPESPPDSSVPFLPAAPTPAPSSSTPAPRAFDAKAMLQAQKWINADPAYGALPYLNEDSTAALEALRELARKKRRRTKAVRWVVGIVFVVGAAVAGAIAYPAYQADQARRTAEIEAADDGDLPGILDTIDVLSGSDTASDVSQAGLIDESVLLPNEARRFATVTDVGDVVVGRSSDDETAYEVQAYLLDVEAYRSSQPQSYSAWLTTWMEFEETDDPDLTFAVDGPESSDRALVAYALDPDGYVQLAAIVDPVSHFRAGYLRGDAGSVGSTLAEG